MLGVSTDQLLMLPPPLCPPPRMPRPRTSSPHIAALVGGWVLWGTRSSSSLSAVAGSGGKMLGVSTGQLLVILGACSVMMKPSDMIKMARVAGRMTGRAVGRLMMYPRQMEDIFEQTAAKKPELSPASERRSGRFFWEFTALTVQKLKEKQLRPRTEPLYITLHDEEWGVSVHGDRELLELLTLS